MLRRNKVDAKGNHPWKAEVSEDDTGVSADTISNWYKEVYEPEFTASEPEVQTANFGFPETE